MRSHANDSRKLRFGFAVLALAAALLVAACNGDNGEPGNGEPVNQPPVADAGPDLEGVVGEPLEITGSGTDPDDDPITFRWSLLDRPTGSTAELEQETQQTVLLTPDVEGAFVLGLVVSDGELESEEDTMTVTALPPELIAGSLTVEVVDSDSGEPISGATVEVEGGYVGQTDADGIVEIVEAGLEGPLTVDVFHPETIEGPSGDLLPRWRGATIVGAVRSSMTVPLSETYRRPPELTGRVAGHVHPTFFEAFPPVGPVVALNREPCHVEDFERDWEQCEERYLNQVGSGQMRAVVLAPLTDKQPLSIEVSDLLGAPASEQSPLPGNLTSDDGFLVPFASIIGIPPAPDGGSGLTWFDIELPAGNQKLLVLGVLITVDTVVLWDLLNRAMDGDPVDPGAILGTMSLETLLIGMLDVEVPAGDTLLFDTQPDPDRPGGLTLDDLDEVHFIPAEIEIMHAMKPYAANPEQEAQTRWAEVSFEATGVVSAQGMLRDPRVESYLPSRAPIRVDGSWEWLDVPEETGEPETHVPYALVVAVAETAEGLFPMGLAFTRAGTRSISEAVFGLPRAEGLFSNAPMQAVGFTARGVGPTGVEGVYDLLPGQAVARQHLSAGASPALADPLPFPSILDPEDAGLRVGLLLERPDRSSTEVTGALAYLIELLEPDPELHLIGDSIDITLPTGAELAHVVLFRRDEIDEGVFVEIPLWDVYVEADADLALNVPMEARELLADGHVRIDVRAGRWSTPFSMESWSAERLRTGPLTYTTDTWLAIMP